MVCGEDRDRRLFDPRCECLLNSTELDGERFESTQRAKRFCLVVDFFQQGPFDAGGHGRDIEVHDPKRSDALRRAQPFQVIQRGVRAWLPKTPAARLREPLGDLAQGVGVFLLEKLAHRWVVQVGLVDGIEVMRATARAVAAKAKR